MLQTNSRKQSVQGRRAYVSIGLSGILAFILSLKIWPSMLTSATCTFCSTLGECCCERLCHSTGAPTSRESQTFGWNSLASDCASDLRANLGADSRMNLAEPRSAAVAPACQEGSVNSAESGYAEPSFCLTCEDDGATLVLNHGWQHLQASATCEPSAGTAQQVAALPQTSWAAARAPTTPELKDAANCSGLMSRVPIGHQEAPLSSRHSPSV